MEYLSLTANISVAVYADEGHHLRKRRSSEDPRQGSIPGINTTSRLPTMNSADDTAANVRPWLPSRYSADDVSSNIEPTFEALTMQSNKPLLGLGTFLRFAIKCADCLEFIHRNNMVHGGTDLSLKSLVPRLMFYN